MLPNESEISSSFPVSPKTGRKKLGGISWTRSAADVMVVVPALHCVRQCVITAGGGQQLQGLQGEEGLEQQSRGEFHR